MDLIFIDTETTGLKDGRLVELAYCRVPRKLEIASPHIECFRVLPPEEISLEAMAVHHITEKMVSECPRLHDMESFSELKEMLESNIIVAHNAPFDIGVLQREGIQVHQFIDTKKFAEKTYPYAGKYGLQYLRYWSEIEISADAHSAKGDVQVLMAFWWKMAASFMQSWNMNYEEAIETALNIKSL